MKGLNGRSDDRQTSTEQQQEDQDGHQLTLFSGLDGGTLKTEV
jgi:hypothetical protein